LQSSQAFLNQFACCNISLFFSHNPLLSLLSLNSKAPFKFSQQLRNNYLNWLKATNKAYHLRQFLMPAMKNVHL